VAIVFTACSELRKVFGSVCDFLFVYEISREPLNGFTPNSQGRLLVPRSVDFECQVQGHQGQKTAFSALSVACERFVCGKTSSAPVCMLLLC